MRLNVFLRALDEEGTERENGTDGRKCMKENRKKERWKRKGDDRINPSTAKFCTYTIQARLVRTNLYPSRVVVVS